MVVSVVRGQLTCWQKCLPVFLGFEEEEQQKQTQRHSQAQRTEQKRNGREHVESESGDDKTGRK